MMTLQGAAGTTTAAAATSGYVSGEGETTGIQLCLFFFVYF